MKYQAVTILTVGKVKIPMTLLVEADTIEAATVLIKKPLVGEAHILSIMEKKE